MLLYFNDSGHSNISIGARSLYKSINRSNLVAVGDSALYNNGVGAMGSEALQNVAVGSKSLYLNTTGSSNTATGYQALYNASTGDGNTAVGDNALYNVTTGSNNTVVGYAGWPTGNATYSNYTGLGYYVGSSVSDPSNRVEIGNNSVTWIGGQVGWSTYSDRRIKDNIQEDVPGLNFIRKVIPVSYNLNIHRQNELVYGDKLHEMGEWFGKYHIEQQRISGFLAQQVAQAARELNYEFSGVTIPENENDLYSLDYSSFVVPLVKAIQELANKNELLETQMGIQQKMVEEQGKIILSQQEMLERLAARLDDN